MSVTGGDTAADLFGNQEEDDSWLYTDKDNGGKKNETEQSLTSGGQLYLNDEENQQASANAENNENELSMNDDAALGELDKTNGANDDNNENKNEDEDDEDEDDDDDDDGDDGINIVIDTNKPSSTLLQQQSALGGPGGLTWQKNKGQVPGAQQPTTAGTGNQVGGKPAQQTKGVDLEAPGTINDQPTYEYNLQELNDEEKPWRKPGADITDYFNYGFNEDTWIAYCLKQRRLRMENNAAKLAAMTNAAAGGALLPPGALAVIPPYGMPPPGSNLTTIPMQNLPGQSVPPGMGGFQPGQPNMNQPPPGMQQNMNAFNKMNMPPFGNQQSRYPGNQQAAMASGGGGQMMPQQATAQFGAGPPPSRPNDPNNMRRVGIYGSDSNEALFNVPPPTDFTTPPPNFQSQQMGRMPPQMQQPNRMGMPPQIMGQQQPPHNMMGQFQYPPPHGMPPGFANFQPQFGRGLGPIQIPNQPGTAVWENKPPSTVDSQPPFFDDKNRPRSPPAKTEPSDASPSKHDTYNRPSYNKYSSRDRRSPSPRRSSHRSHRDYDRHRSGTGSGTSASTGGNGRDRSRDRERDQRDRSRERDRSRDRDREKSSRDKDRSRSRDKDRSRSRSRDDKYKRTRRRSEEEDYKSSSKSHKRKKSRKDRDNSNDRDNKDNKSAHGTSESHHHLSDPTSNNFEIKTESSAS